MAPFVVKKYAFMVLVLASTAALGLSASNSFATTSDYYRCNSKVGGEYNYGRAPMACDANAFGDDRLVQTSFAPLIFQDGRPRQTERERYGQEMYSLIREAAVHYYKTKQPAATSGEIGGWVNAVEVTAAHESYWSHYREASDAKLKLMRGDFGHGHGLMQIDDRAHFPAVTNGTAWNIVTSLVYAMDILYPFWQKAPSQSCVGSPSNYEARTRAAWASYNSGSTKKLCRWTNPSDPWAANDKNFYEQLRGRAYEKIVGDKGKASSLNVPCLMEKKENCPLSGPAAATDLQPGVLYQTAQGLSCVISTEHAFCVSEVRDAICLNAVTRLSSNAGAATATTIDAQALARYSPEILDRHRACSLYDSSLLAVGTSIETLRDLNLRSTPGGGILGTVAKGKVLQVLDFELRNAPTNDRYYKVRSDNLEGYLYGGAAADAGLWMIASTPSVSDSIAKAGETVRVHNPAGINLRSAPGGALLGHLPVETEVQVLTVKIQGSENSVYYEVSYGGKVGTIYSGLLLPANTTSQWTTVLRL